MTAARSLILVDTNVWIDLIEGRLERAFLLLPDYGFCSPGPMYEKELQAQHGYLPDLGLELLYPSEEAKKTVEVLFDAEPDLSYYDRLILVQAKEQGCLLLTGDKRLRRRTEAAGVICRGSIWAVEELIKRRSISIEEARKAYARMRGAGRRLPFEEALESLEMLEASMRIVRDAPAEYRIAV